MRLLDALKPEQVPEGTTFSRCEETARLEEAARLRKVVALASNFVLGLGGARLRKADLERFDPLMMALHAMPMVEFARCLDSIKETK